MDCIACVLSAPGTSALAVIRLTGTAADQVIARFFQPVRQRPAGDVPRYGNWLDSSGTVLDDLIVVQRSQTAFDIYPHGGLALVEAILQNLVAVGVRVVSTAEQLAVEGHGRWAIAARLVLPLATTAKATAVLLDQAQGALDSAWPSAAEKDAVERAQRLLAWSRFGQHLVEPWKIAFLGQPNAGKSSLINRLAGFERAIVADEAGTTRDVLGVDVAFRGWPVRLIDGAGFRVADSDIEEQGQSRLAAMADKADWRVLVVDGTRPSDPVDRQLAERLAVDLIVINKADLVDVTEAAWSFPGIEKAVLIVSAKSGAGIDALVTALADSLVPIEPAVGQPIPFTVEQEAELVRLVASLDPLQRTSANAMVD